MAFTDNSDVYAAIHEDGINRVVDHLMVKRPSLFNYGTARMVAAAVDVAAGRRPRIRPCGGIDAAREVTDAPWNNPLMTEQEPFAVIGTDDMVALDYCFQVVEMELDFAPDDLGLDVGDQQFGAHVEVCAGLACPEDLDAVFDELRAVREEIAERGQTVAAVRDDEALSEEYGVPIVPEPETVFCFCLDVSVIGSVDLVDRPATGPPVELLQSPRFAVHNIRVDDVHGGEFDVPKGMRASIECYLRAYVQLGLLPALSEVVERIGPLTLEMETPVFDVVSQELLARISFPESGAIPHNPAVEDDEFRAYVDLELTVAEDGGGS